MRGNFTNNSNINNNINPKTPNNQRNIQNSIPERQIQQEQISRNNLNNYGNTNNNNINNNINNNPNFVPQNQNYPKAQQNYSTQPNHPNNYLRQQPGLQPQPGYMNHNNNNNNINNTSGGQKNKKNQPIQGQGNIIQQSIKPPGYSTSGVGQNSLLDQASPIEPQAIFMSHQKSPSSQIGTQQHYSMKGEGSAYQHPHQTMMQQQALLQVQQQQQQQKQQQQPPHHQINNNYVPSHHIAPPNPNQIHALTSTPQKSSAGSNAFNFNEEENKAQRFFIDISTREKKTSLINETRVKKFKKN